MTIYCVMARQVGKKKWAFVTPAMTTQELRDVLHEVRELIEGYVDVVDGDLGPAPNAAMRATVLIDEILGGK